MKRMLNFLCACVLFISIIELQAKELKKIYLPFIQKDAKMLDANQISMYVLSNGTTCRHPETGNAGLFYPKGTENNCVYVAGLWIAGKVSGQIRTACADYNSEYQAGNILPDGSPDNPTLEKYRVYKIKPGDSANPSDPNYNIDYAEWPVTDGAPIDKAGNPLIIGDQTLWCVMNDGNADLHSNCYNTQPLNIEVHLLTWAFDENTSPLGKIVFLHYTIINKGADHIEDVYIGMYLDPDLGFASDDNCACDTTLNLTYCYNGKDMDGVYGTAVPAVGFCLLQGPIISSSGDDEAQQFFHDPIQNAKTLNITANMRYY